MEKQHFFFWSKRRLVEEEREAHSCFLALERAADSLFLIIRLCLLFPEPSLDSWPLFLPKQVKSSREVLNEGTSVRWLWLWRLEVTRGSWLSRNSKPVPEFKLRTVAGGGKGELLKRAVTVVVWPLEEEPMGMVGSWFKGPLRKSWKMESGFWWLWLLNLGSWLCCGCWLWRFRWWMSSQTSSMVIKELFWASWESCDECKEDDEDDGDEDEMEETVLRILFLFVTEILWFLWCFADDIIGIENQNNTEAHSFKTLVSKVLYTTRRERE